MAATLFLELEKETEGNQQRKTALQVADKLSTWNTAKGTAVHTDLARATRAPLKQFLTNCTPAMAIRNPAAARAASSAVTGPCTTE
jgi:hypothetical protein